MRPDECRVCWDPVCLGASEDGPDGWADYAPAGEHCPFFVPEPVPLKPCSCCGSDSAMIDVFEEATDVKVIVVCEECGTCTKRFSSPQDAIKAWNDGEVYSE